MGRKKNASDPLWGAEEHGPPAKYYSVRLPHPTSVAQITPVLGYADKKSRVGPAAHQTNAQIFLRAALKHYTYTIKTSVASLSTSRAGRLPRPLADTHAMEQIAP